MYKKKTFRSYSADDFEVRSMFAGSVWIATEVVLAPEHGLNAVYRVDYGPAK